MKSEKHTARAALSSFNADLKAERTYDAKVRILREATIAFRAGQLTQESWFKIRGRILGKHLSRPAPSIVEEKEPGIREIPEDIFPTTE